MGIKIKLKEHDLFEWIVFYFFLSMILFAILSIYAFAIGEGIYLILSSIIFVSGCTTLGLFALFSFLLHIG